MYISGTYENSTVSVANTPNGRVMDRMDNAITSTQSTLQRRYGRESDALQAAFIADVAAQFETSLGLPLREEVHELIGAVSDRVTAVEEGVIAIQDFLTQEPDADDVPEDAVDAGPLREAALSGPVRVFAR